MDDLVRWLGAQLDEDERIARDADPGPWNNNSLGRHDQSVIKLGAPTSTSMIQFDGSRAAANGAHAARHDPSRVLREIDAKRQILARYEFACHEAAALDISEEERETRVQVAAAFQSCALLLAAVYADREGYRAEWVPTT